jgi:hypothetical protein
MLAVQSSAYNGFMQKHRKAGEELWWFSAMDAANKAATQPDPNDR